MRGLILTAMMIWSFISVAGENMITLKQAQSLFSITVDANPTTGYSWSIKEMDKDNFRLLKKQYTAVNQGLIGSGGKTEFKFKVVNKAFKGKSQIVLVYSRPWDPKSGTSKIFTICRK